MSVVRVLELRSVWGTGGGPEKTIILGAARADRSRYAVTVCYIRDERDEVFGPADRLATSDVDYVEVRERNSFDPGIWPALKTIVAERRIDIVHAHDYKTNVIALALRRSLGVIPLSTVHGWTGHSPRERWLYYPLDKRVLSRFPRLVAVSSDIRNELIRTGTKPERVQTILNGIDHEAFRRDRTREAAAREALGLAPGQFVIGAIGRAEPQKRFDLLIKAFAEVKQRHSQCVLVIAGDGSCLAALRTQVADGRLTDSVRLLGHCT
ncbi:MAG: glycosyltransferase, partial [Acidobacteria bacterium]|nr:glycosyltransferase [Acidobacteriota bacterium]